MSSRQEFPSFSSCRGQLCPLPPHHFDGSQISHIHTRAGIPSQELLWSRVEKRGADPSSPSLSKTQQI